MKKQIPLAVVWGLTVVLALVPAARAGENYLIESRLFRGTQEAKTPLPASVVIIKSFSDPVFLPAPPSAFSAEAELSFVSAMRTELRGVFKLAQVDHLSSGRIVWDGAKEDLNEAIVLEGTLYPFVYHPRLLADGRIALRIEVSRHKAASAKVGNSAWDEGEKILDTDLAFGPADPVVLGFPVNGHAYFLSIQIREDSRPESERDLNKLIQDGDVVWPSGFYIPPKPRFQVTPLYPKSCKDKLIEGTVTLFLKTDKTGRVTSVRVWRKANPDLEKSALDALRQWTFDPDLASGKPIPSIFFMSVDYKLKAVSGTPLPAPAAGRAPNSK